MKFTYIDGISLLKDSNFLRGHLTEDTYPQTRPRERMTAEYGRIQPESFADAAHLILEEQPKRLHDLEIHLLRKAAHIVMALDGG